MGKEKRIVQSIDHHFSSLFKDVSKLEAMYQCFSDSLEQYKDRKKSTIEDQFNKDEKELKVKYTRQIEELKYQHISDTKREKASFKDSIDEINHNFKKTEKELHETLSKETAKIEKNAETKKQSLEKKFLEEMAEIKNNLVRIEQEHTAEWLSWDDPFWKDFEPIKNMQDTPLTRFGELNIKGKTEPLNIPALLRIITSKNVLINASGNQKDAALEALRVIMLRLLVTIPPGKLNFVLIDPVGLGSNMAGFMHLPEGLVGKKIWTEPNHIERQLADLSTHMETIIQKYLRNDYVNMEEYNEKAGEVAEPYRLLVVANFPANFTESAAQRLVSIASNGPRTGVYVLVMRDTEQKLPYNFRIEELERLSTIVDHDGTRFIWKDADYEDHKLIFDELPSVKLVERLLKRIGEESILACHVEVPFKLALDEAGKWWSHESDEGLSVPIGRSGARDLQHFSVGKGTLQHVLVAGKTGSGKSNLLHVIIMTLCINYSPNEIELYLIDFKKGIEFKTYAEENLPHARVIAIQSEREFGLSVLQGLDSELQRRGDIFRDAGVQKMEGFRQKNKKMVMPRIVLLVDEFQEFFTEDDAIASHASLLLDRLVRQGRAFGIHIILASQALAGTYTISRSTTDQMAIRIALQCTDTDSRLILGEDNPNARLLSRPGEAYYNDANGLIEGNSLFQVFFLSDEERERYLKDFHILDPTGKFFKERRAVVFEGNAPSGIEGNMTLQHLLSTAGSPERRPKLLAWLGEPIAMKPHVCATFQRQSRSSLIIVGQNEESAVAMLITSLISLAAQRLPDDIEFHVLDLSKAGAPWNGIINSLPQIFPHPIFLYKKRHINEAIEQLFEVVKEREEVMDDGNGRDIFLCIVGVHRAPSLRSSDGYTYPEATEKLFHILTNGPDYGVHTICWGDTCKNIERALSRNISEFDLRVALQMSITDSNEVIDSPDANKLGRYRALLYDEEKVGNLEKFRPYALPTHEWLEFVGKELSESKTIVID